MGSPWTHGDWTHRNRVVEVREVKSMRRGLPSTSLGWEAKIELEGVVIITTHYHPSKEAAQERLLNSLNALHDYTGVGICEHGVADGDWCVPCNLEQKRAAKESGNV